MRITEMQITPIAIADPPLLNAGGLHAPYALRIILELVCDDGVYGLGEIPGSDATAAALADARKIVIGKDPFQLNAIRAGLEERFGTVDEATGESAWNHRTMMHCFSAIEVACFDLMGKATGRPVVDLLGGRVRDRVPFSAYLFYKYEGAGGELGKGIDPAATGWAAARQAAALDPAGVVAQAQAMCDAFGFESIKLKGGAMPPDEEVAAMVAMHEAFGPETPLRLDPNAIWSVETAIRCGKKMEGGVLEYYEDPVRGQEAMAEVGKAVDIPMATNMCTTSFDAIPNSVAVHAEDIILSDHHFWGGLRSSIELSRICKTFDRGLSMHSNSHVGISLMAMAHLAAATPNLTYACDTHYPWQSEEVIVGGRIQFEDGTLAVGNEPGLGIELDRAALAKLHENYVRCGLTERNDEVEMQKVNPGWTFESTRW